MPRSLPWLLGEARIALHIGSQGELGEQLGSSARSGQRWERGEAIPSPGQIQQLARLVYPHDASLAAEIAAAGGSSLETLGLVQPPSPPPVAAPPAAAPAPPPPDPKYLVDTVVCAAAEAMQMMPEQIRPALRAAFRRARLAGLSVDDCDRGLSGPDDAAEGSSGAS